MEPKLRKTKIICTIGPASQEEPMLRQLIRQGMNVARLNFSHDSHEGHKLKADRIKRLREEEGRPVALMMDTRGPEVRTGDFVDGEAELVTGTTVWIRHEEVLGTAEAFSVTYKDLNRDLSAGDRVLLDDGLIEMRVRSIEGRDIRCEVINGGPISNHKSVNFPGIDLSLPALSEQDREDLRFAVEQDFDFIAVSFVRSADDILTVRHVLERLGGDEIFLVAKIENRSGIRNFDQILEAADGVMIARGDLGVEIPTYEVPTLQKTMISRCYKRGKPCITATQMLDSMIRNPRPTRAEVSDVANAILDGSSAVMLSGETASGRHPLESLVMMREIATYTEASIDYWDAFDKADWNLRPSVTNAVSHACCMTAKDLDAAAIIAVTHSGRTARQMSRFRPACPIIATTVGARQQRQLSLSWGVEPCLVTESMNTDELFQTAIETALGTGLVKQGDLVVISGGTPIGMSGTTNTLRVANVGHILCHGTGVPDSAREVVSGEVYNGSELLEHDEHVNRTGFILVAHDTNNAMIRLARRAAAIVVETEDPACHAVTVAGTLDIPVIYGCENATRLLDNGQLVTVDAMTGRVS